MLRPVELDRLVPPSEPKISGLEVQFPVRQKEPIHLASDCSPTCWGQYVILLPHSSVELGQGVKGR